MSAQLNQAEATAAEARSLFQQVSRLRGEIVREQQESR